MIKNGIFTLSSAVLCGALFFPGYSLQTRFYLTLLSFFLLFGICSHGWNQESRFSLRSWICSHAYSWVHSLYAAIFLLAALVLIQLRPETGITVTHFPLSGEKEEILVDLPSWNIHPLRIPQNYLSSDSSSVHYSSSFSIPEPIHSLLFYVSYGEATWILDGIPIAQMHRENSNRYVLYNPGHDIPAGDHTIECRLSNQSPLPHVSMLTGNQKPISGPFFGHINPWDSFSHRFYNLIIPILCLLAALCIIPTMNVLLLRISCLVQQYSKSALFLGFLLSLSIFLSIRILFFVNTNRFFEADEAAFGIMSERLLSGQSPPLFHYSQDYQGTLEAFPLALSLLFSDSSTEGLHLLPLIWGIGFLLTTVFSFWKYGSAGLSLFVFFWLSVGGLHFHWILSKTWFGYPFSLFCGSLLWVLALHGYNKNRLTPGIALLWGSIAGIGFYQLPLCLPFILSSGLIVFKLFIDHIHLTRRKNPQGKSRIITWIRQLLISSHRSGLAMVLFMFTLFSSAYWISPILDHNLGVLQFLFKGRALAPARMVGENPVIDRFFSECLPVLLGVRSPYDHLNDLPSSWIPMVPPLIFLIGFLLFPLAFRKILSPYPWLNGNTLRFSFFVFSLSTILFVSFSPFGIWPWYAIPLFWIIPLFLFVLIRFLWNFSPFLSVSAITLYLLSTLTAFVDYNPFFHQPSSLSYQTLWVPTEFSRIKSILRENNIRYILCDQGFDMIISDPGRDWVGECLSFDSQEEFVSVSRLSRRIPDSSQELIDASRVGYLFHKNFYFSSPVPGEHSPIARHNLDLLFGKEYLDYEYYEVDPYILYLPRINSSNLDKSNWTLESTNPIFLTASVDHNLGLRGVGREAYWSSDRIPEDGCLFRIRFQEPKPMQSLLLYHGTKTTDRTDKNDVRILLENNTFMNAGSLSFRPQIQSSILNLDQQIMAKEIEIRAFPPENGQWWTIFEVWVY